MRSYNHFSLTAFDNWKCLENNSPCVLHVLRSHSSYFLAQSRQDLNLYGAGSSIVHADTKLLLRALLRKCNLPAFLNTAMKNHLPVKVNKYFIKNCSHLELNPEAVKYKRGFQADFP